VGKGEITSPLIHLSQKAEKGGCGLLVKELKTAWESDSGIAAEVQKKPKQWWLFPSGIKRRRCLQ